MFDKEHADKEVEGLKEYLDMVDERGLTFMSPEIWVETEVVCENVSNLTVS